MAQVKKLSVATVYGKISLTKLIAERTIPVMKVYGRAVSTKSGVTAYGEFTALQGSFKAVHPETGKMSQAAVLFLPDVALLPIQTALSQSNGVDFAIQVSAKYVADDAGHKAGGSVYEYTFESLIPAATDDPVARIEAQLLALQGPTAPEKVPETPAADTPAETPKAKNGKK